MSEIVAGFELVREQEIPELSTHGRLLRHTATGAQVLSLENGDENKVFGITFLTPPPDSSGVAHIMEHSVLCGSRKYPTKEPFVELAKSSLKTFLNAFTYPDRTCYPVASQNLHDFYNLVDVYLDAVFFPRLTPFTLQQEGWHYELDALDAPLRFKGVVFNEMKGAYSSADSLIGRYSQHAIFPDTIYGFDSGGDPRVIPTLTWEAFKRFHETHYHPSNAFIFFYGDDAPEQRLRLLTEYLDQFAAATIPPGITTQAPFEAPRRVVERYDPGEASEPGTAYVLVNWRLVPNDDPERTLGLSILSYALVGNQAAPLRKALVDSGLGEAVIGGLSNGLHTATFSSGLKGVAPENTGRVEALILETLQRLAADGLEDATIEAALNATEFALREQNTGGTPRGLAYMLQAITRWIYGSDPLAALAFDAPLAAIKRRVAAGERYFETLLRDYLQATEQRVTVEMLPEAGYAARQTEAEAARLAEIRAGMSEDELRATLANSAELKRRQAAPDSPEALATIPTLTLGDMERASKVIPREVEREQDATILFHDLATNGIVYVSLGLDLHVLPPRLLPYVGLLRKALLTMGTQREDYVTLSQRIDRETGGFSVSEFGSMTLQPDAPAAARLMLHGKATTERVGELFAIARDVLTTVKLDDRERFRQILLEEKARREGGIVSAGSSYAALRVAATFDEAARANEQWGGISYLLFLQDLAARFDDEWPRIRDTLRQTWWTLLNRRGMIVNVTADGSDWQRVRPALAAFLATLAAADAAPADWSVPQQAQQDEGFAIPSLVNFVAKSMNLFDHGYQLHGSWRAILNWLRTSYLWSRVRVQGGAYGAFSGLDTETGRFTFSSYRDPNVERTLATYDAAAQALREAEISQQELERSIIGAIGVLDAYQLPDAKGYTSLVRYLNGISDELRQQRREELLGTTRADFQRFGAALGALREEGRVVVLGALEALDSANAARPGWLRITRLAL